MNSRFRSIPRSFAQSPLVGKSRRAAGLFVAPVYHGHITSLHSRDNDHEARLAALERLEPLVHHMPALLNTIATVNGTARLLRSEFDDVRDQVRATAERADVSSERVARLNEMLDALAKDVYEHIGRLDGYINDQLWPVTSKVEGLDGDRQTLAWLVQRVEAVRSEVMYEMRYGGARAAEAPRERRVVNEAALAAAGEDGPRLNLGCGLLPLEGYVNVDMREMPGVDVVAPVDDLPFDPGSAREIFSAHTLEHFPQEELVRTLLPYWYSMLRPGGTFRAVVPDLEAMMGQYQRGEIPFEQWRLVAYGGQEYEGDFHHTAFTPESLTGLLDQAGFIDVDVVERARPNGDCLEFEVAARRPG